MGSSTPISDDIYVHEDDNSDSKHVLVESGMLVQVARYSLTTSKIEDEIEHKIVVTSVVISTKPSKSHRADCQIHTYFLHKEKKPVHLLNLNPFPKESQEIEIKFIVITPNISSSSKLLE